ncbi:MAG: hypothetical protein HZB26_01805 [Candidatus Hydrogenedentes bacterium]|nr:hypothetical protein [Candidatus Hydrogenedentota bacterium]
MVRTFAMSGLIMVLAVASKPAHALDYRMAAYHKTVIGASETAPHVIVFTYLKDGVSYTRSNVLAKLVPKRSDKDSAPEGLHVEDFPGGVTSDFDTGSVHIRTETEPLLIGRGTEAWEGAMLYSIESDPATPLAVDIGGPEPQEMGLPPGISSAALQPLPQLELAPDSASFLGGAEKMPVAIRVSGTLVSNGLAAQARFDSGRGWILLTYADTLERAKEIARLDPLAARAQVTAHYAALLENQIDTPEETINQAFRAALYNLEYNWIAPYGWNECIHHWLSLWHNQHTAGAEWIGQEDRSRQCTAYHAEHLLPGGAIPQFYPNGRTHRDFGGSNQFWTWQARHYWRFTGDKSFAEAVAPALDKVLAQTFAEHDPDGNLLLDWGQQIGNQEDFVQFYHDAATPTIEVINMMRTAAEFAEARSDAKAAAMWNARADTARERLCSALWMRDLGRFASYVDEHGKQRPDAQYHAFLYPALWDIVDPLDAYSSLRHVHDRLTGANGDVYCSNNFPNHDVGTWGMQSGAAQQPWAAWAFSKAGQFEHTWRPLKAVSDWVMSPEHRGAWPEISTEPTPAYFTPPAGLFVASVAEALFGLRVDAPSGVVEIAPSFPEHWPRASMRLAHYSAEYRRSGARLGYTVRSATPLARRLKWTLPPARVARVTANGAPLPFAVQEGVQHIVLTAETAAETETTFEIEYQPEQYEIDAPTTIAEGELFHAKTSGLQVLDFDDRCGVLASTDASDPDRFNGRIQRGLLAPYLPYGRLGLMTFSRRTFFLHCETKHGVRFWRPIDLTILPRVEAAPQGEITLAADSLDVPLLVRNNTESPVQGQAWLHVAQNSFPVTVDIPARSEIETQVTVPASLAALFSLGDNRASLALPGEEPVAFTLPCVQPFRDNAPLREFAAKRLTALALPADTLASGLAWTELRPGGHGGPVAWPGWKPPLEGLEAQAQFEAPELPGLSFQATQGKWALVGERIGKPYLRMELNGKVYKKFFLLLATFADNHDMYTRLGQVTVRGPKGVIDARTLHLPGDVDWWEHKGMGATMGTARLGHPSRFGLLPLLKPGQTDWAEGVPPAFPQPEFWASSVPLTTPNCTFSVVEIELAAPQPVTSLSLNTEGICPGFAIMAVTAETADDTSLLHDTPFLPPPAFRTPRRLFSFNTAGDDAGWSFDGDAFSVSDFMGTISLNSAVKRGEGAVGKAESPSFTIGPDDSRLLIEFMGGRNVKGNLSVRLVDASSAETLHTLEPPGTHMVTPVEIPLKPWRGRSARIELVDQNADSSYAWIGLKTVSISEAE